MWKAVHQDIWWADYYATLFALLGSLLGLWLMASFGTHGRTVPTLVGATFPTIAALVAMSSMRKANRSVAGRVFAALLVCTSILLLVAAIYVGLTGWRLPTR